MRLRKNGYLQPNTEKKRIGMTVEKGQASWVLGLFWILFLAILLCMQLQVALYRASSMYLEDALALSNLASAVIDIQEYGRTHRVLIPDPEQAYDRYCSAVKENLGLDDNYEAVNHKLITGQVQIQKYIIYNVRGQKVSVWERNSSGQVQEWQGSLGEVRTPAGQLIETTGVYSEISYPVEGFLGVTVTAGKSKLVDVVSENNGEEINEQTEDESETEKQDLEWQYIGSFSGCSGSICLPAADREKSTCGV